MSIGSDTSFYLDSATLNLTGGCGVGSNTTRIGPNPVTDKLSVLVSDDKASRVTVLLHDAPGKLVYRQTQTFAGAVTLQVPMKHLSSGLYFLSIYLDDRKQPTKVIRK